MITEGSRWKHVQLVGSDLDLRKVSWKLPADIIPCRLSPDTDASDSHAQTLAQGEDLSLAVSMPATPNVNSCAIKVANWHQESQSANWHHFSCLM